MIHVNHILEVIASIGANAGGTGKFMSDISMYLPDTACDFSLLTSSVAGAESLPVDRRVRSMVVPAFRKGLSGHLGVLSRPGVKSALKQIDRERALDLIHVHGIWLNICRESGAWGHSAAKPVVVSPHGMLEAWALNHKKFKKKLAWLLYQRRELESVRAFHACSEQEALSIRSLGFSQPIAVIPNGVELPALPLATESQSGKVAELKVERKTALFLSRINPKKGLPMLLDAWKKVAPGDWRLVIAGNDDANHLPVVTRKIKELGLQQQVELAGPLFGAAKEAAYRNADIFVLPSYSENFGIVVTEALGYQVPVLTTTGCPWGELQTERCGWWVEPTPTGIQTGLTQALATSDADLAEMGVRGRHLVEAKYQWPGIADRMFEFYEWILNGGKQPKFII